MVSGWREFPFFDVTPISDPSLGDEPLYSDPNLLAVANGDETVFLSTRDGRIKQFDKSLSVIKTFKAAEPSWSLDFLYAVPNTPYLVTVATLQGEPALVTLWDTKRPKEDGSMAVHAQFKVANGTNTFPLTCFCSAKDASIMAFGYADGAVVAVRGDILHDRGSRQRLVYTAPNAVTGLVFADETDYSLLFVTSLTTVVTISTSGRREPETRLEKTKGAEYGCVAKLDDDLVVGREAEICYYSAGRRGPSLDFAVQKKAVSTYKHYLVVVALWSQGSSMLATDTIRLMIVDTRNNLIAFNGHLSLSIKHVFVQWGRLNVIGSDGILYVLEEKSLDQQLAILKQQQLFQVAISMANSAQADHRQVMLLHQEYADYLYDRDDAEGAMPHYIAAISLGNTSHVILRYKDSQTIASLTKYLETLYKRHLATPQHLTLLTICYTHLGDQSRLTKFLQKATEDPDFDFEATIECCRNAKYYALTAMIAEKWPDPDLVVQIKLRDMHDFKGCLDYICTISVADALRVLIQNSRLLLNELPVETTGLLITLFTGKFVPKAPKSPVSASVSASASASASASGASSRAASVASAATSVAAPAPSERVPVLQSYQAFMRYISSSNYLGSSVVDAETLEKHNDMPSYQPPRPRLIFPSFIGHDSEFVIFLEACLETAKDFQPSEKDYSDLVTTLYEVYLVLARTMPTERSQWREKAEALIDSNRDHLHTNTVLMVAQMADVQLGPKQVVALGGSYLDLFRQAVDQGNVDDALSLLDEYGSEDKELQTLALRFFVSSQQAFDKAKPRLTSFVEKLVKDQVYSMAQVIQLVSASPYVTIGDIRPFLERYYEQETAEIARNNKISASYAQETAQKETELKKLMADPVIVKYADCNLCGTPLDLPAVHFACKHSYHKRCLGDSDECRECLPEMEGIRSVRKTELEQSAKQEVFFDSLGEKDRFRVITDFISRGGLT